MATDRWQRDPGISELLAHLDRPEVYGDMSALSRSELCDITAELQKCQASFEYAARNYFWIVNKQRGDMLFRLWAQQEMLLERLYALKERLLPQKLYIVKSRQLGVSTLAEALEAWRTIFFANVRGLLVSVDEDHSSDLFSKILHILDHLPWWMKPMVAAREYKEGIWFANPNEAMRSNPDTAGLNSKVTVQHSTQYAGIGQGITINICHVSEIADWMDATAKQAIEGDLKYALPNNPDTIGLIETTGHGAGSYAERLWLSNLDLGEFADWHTVFLPWFFDKTLVLAPPQGWKPEERYTMLRERVSNDWVICPKCGATRESQYGGSPLFEKPCIVCSQGTFTPYRLTDRQLCWYHKEWINHEKKGVDALKTFKEEMATTAQEAFQLTGIQVFDEDCQEWVNSKIRKPVFVGYLDERGFAHGLKDSKDPKNRQCVQAWCDINHTFDTDQPLKIWEWPANGEEYVIGVDVAAGVNQDYSVAFVNRKGKGQNRDCQVALFRSNTIDAVEFARPAVQLGYLYNEAMLSIEYNYPTCADTVRIQYQYPNLYRWKFYDHTGNAMSNRWHWQTTEKTKPKLWQTARRWLRAKIWVVHSENFLYELKRFQKETDRESDKRTGAASGFHDDEIMAGMIALYTGHDLDTDDATALSVRSAVNYDTPDTSDYKMTCLKCGSTWGAANPEGQRCPNCNSIMVHGKPQTVQGLKAELDWGELDSKVYEERGEMSYDAL